MEQRTHSWDKDKAAAQKAPLVWQLCSHGPDKGLVMLVLREVEEVDINFLING